MHTSSSTEGLSPALPRWMQVLVGVLIAVASLLCAGMSVMAALGADTVVPLRTVVATLAVVAACAWLLVLAGRLIAGRRVTGGLMSPRLLRGVAAGFLLLPIVGLFTGYYREGGVLAIIQSGIFVAAAVSTWSLAKARALRPGYPSDDNP
jgi:hypothetical protein